MLTALAVSMAQFGVVTYSGEPPAEHLTSYRTVVADGLPELDKRLSDELDKFNAAATPDVAAAEELTVHMEEDGELVARASG